MGSGQIIYEVTLSPDPSIAAAFDTWLEEHVREMLTLPGFLGASIHHAADPASDGLESVVMYRLENRDALQAYLHQHAEAMRSRGVERFGDRFQASRRVYDAGQEFSAAQSSDSNCANCDASLRGQYCAYCGQRARGRMISVWELVKEASEILTSLDSRLWRTLGQLVFHPGRLTRDYLLGKRARYIPALRLFLGLSLLFFFLFSLNTRFEVTPGGEGDDGDIGMQIQVGEEPEKADGIPEAPPDSEAPPDETEATDEPGQCADFGVDIPEELAWTRAWLSEERLKATCEKIVADHGASFGRALLENIPLMMFVFLPFMSFIMKALYPLSRRFYVEHLLFLVHYHSFFYLLLAINMATGWLFNGDRLTDTPAVLLNTVSAVYIPLYLFRAMRVVYTQGRMLTALKYVTLGLAYFTSLLLMLLATVTVTAISL
jgi:quinol monooxygenase YgiN